MEALKQLKQYQSHAIVVIGFAAVIAMYVANSSAPISEETGNFNPAALLSLVIISALLFKHLPIVQSRKIGKLKAHDIYEVHGYRYKKVCEKHHVRVHYNDHDEKWDVVGQIELFDISSRVNTVWPAYTYEQKKVEMCHACAVPA